MSCNIKLESNPQKKEGHVLEAAWNPSSSLVCVVSLSQNEQPSCFHAIGLNLILKEKFETWKIEGILVWICCSLLLVAVSETNPEVNAACKKGLVMYRQVTCSKMPCNCEKFAKNVNSNTSLCLNAAMITRQLCYTFRNCCVLIMELLGSTRQLGAAWLVYGSPTSTCR